MTKTTTNLLGIIITILAGTYFYITCCSSYGANVNEEPIKNEMTVPAASKATSYPFGLSNGDFEYSTSDNFNLTSYDYLEPLSQKVRDGIIPGLKNYLTEKVNKVINITGYNKGNETYNSAVPNLGLARANEVKNYFVSQEIPSSQINTRSKLMAEMELRENFYLGPVAYETEESRAKNRRTLISTK